MSLQRLSVAFLSLSAMVLMAGCSANFDPMDGTTPPQTELGSIKGSVYGGRAPITGAQVYVFQVGAGGYGGAGIAAATANASTSLLTSVTTGTFPTAASTSGATNGDYYITTDAFGNFDLGGPGVDYTCTAGSVVYLYSLGGVTLTASAPANPQAGLMAILGTCPAGGTFSQIIPGYVYMNEVSTVAAAYSLAGFATDPVHISSSGSALAISNLQNAAKTSLNLYNLFSPVNSQYLGCTGCAVLTTPGGNGTAPQAEVDTLANILVSCMNTANTATTSSQQCNNLRAYATNNGVTGTVVTSPAITGYSTNAPSDTAQAMINIAHYPASNVANLCLLQGSGAAAVYTPDLACGGQDAGTPYTWTLDISYTGIGIITYTGPRLIAVDASGDIWYADEQANTLDKFNTVGVESATYTTGTLPFSAAVDTAGNTWVTNSSGNTLTEVSAAGVVSTISTGLGLNSPLDAEFDGSGNLFIANAGANTLVKATSAGVYTSKTTAAQEKLDFPYSVALGPGATSVVWSASATLPYISYFTNALVSTADKEVTSRYQSLIGSAVDANGNAWFGQSLNSTTAVVCDLVKAVGGTTLTTTLYNPGSGNYYVSEYNGLAIDGASNVWSTDDDNAVIYENSNAGTTLTGTYGIVPAGNTAYGGSGETSVGFPNSIAVDGSGNVWYDLEADNGTAITGATLHELVGAGVPVVTPLAYATKTSTLGSRP